MSIFAETINPPSIKKIRTKMNEQGVKNLTDAELLQVAGGKVSAEDAACFCPQVDENMCELVHSDICDYDSKSEKSK